MTMMTYDHPYFVGLLECAGTGKALLVNVRLFDLGAKGNPHNIAGHMNLIRVVPLCFDSYRTPVDRDIGLFDLGNPAKSALQQDRFGTVELFDQVVEGTCQKHAVILQ